MLLSSVTTESVAGGSLGVAAAVQLSFGHYHDEPQEPAILHWHT